jgi:hypothetical protein
MGLHVIFLYAVLHADHPDDQLRCNVPNHKALTVVIGYKARTRKECEALEP